MVSHERQGYQRRSKLYIQRRKKHTGNKKYKTLAMSRPVGFRASEHNNEQ